MLWHILFLFHVNSLMNTSANPRNSVLTDQRGDTELLMKNGFCKRSLIIENFPTGIPVVDIIIIILYWNLKCYTL